MYSIHMDKSARFLDSLRSLEMTAEEGGARSK